MKKSKTALHDKENLEMTGEKLLEELAWLDGVPGEREMPGDHVLEAYRAGRLEGDEARRIEALLIESPAARSRLAELAGVGREAPPLGLRRQVLESFGGPAPRSRSRRARLWLPAAAVAAVLLVAIGVGLRPETGLPADLEYEVTARGLAEARSLGEATPSGAIEATPDTRVRIAAEPRSGATSELEFGLYRLSGEHLEKLGAAEGVELEAHRGAALWQARAGDLFGEEPGRYGLWVVISRPGGLPARVELDPGEDAIARLSSSRRRLVYHQRVLLRPR